MSSILNFTLRVLVQVAVKQRPLAPSLRHREAELRSALSLMQPDI